MTSAPTRKTDLRGPSDWGVVMTVNEPAALVLCNVRWHLATGACAVHVFLDDAGDPVARELGAIDGCHVTLCDDAYWAVHRGQKGRPASQMRRQSINAHVAKTAAQIDWLFHIDADEFIWQDGDFAGELAAQGDISKAVNLTVLERLFPQGAQQSLFDGSFRATSALSETDAQMAFGEFAPFMKRGQYSHGAGKSGIRTSADLRLGVHHATRTGSEGRQRRAAHHIATTARLLHFDGVTPLHWLAKVLRYKRTPPRVQGALLQPHRAAQVAWMMERSTELGTARDAHHALFALTSDRQKRLEQFDLLQDIPFDPAARIGAGTPDLSPAAFDADLLQRNPWIRDNLIGD
ncbi:glycosyltransferase family 2 protein [uncultured Tateyamaria sp.]|uniref:glycosyltransferase family 2 protein n=1 Tax=uncultured Tateyamaria sp. TaxID=455651 RepID=UPI0026289409|nr:glycosyltransferase family 2 protein [uncultured Tateyamaria sp.]